MVDNTNPIIIYRCNFCHNDLENCKYTIEIAKKIFIPHKTANSKSLCEGFFEFYKLKFDEDKVKNDVINEIKQDIASVKQDVINQIKEEKNVEKVEKKKINEEKQKKKKEKINTSIEDLDAEFFHVDDKPYIAFKIRDHREIRPMIGKPFKDYIGILLNIKGKDREELVNDWIAYAMHGTKEYKLYARCAWHKDDIWYDLSNKDWNAVRITREGWSICQPPILFHRYTHQESQVEPDKIAEITDIDKLFDVIRLDSDDDKKLFKINLVCKFVPWIAHPIDITHGSYGSTKSSDDRIKKSLVDPSKLKSVAIGQNVIETVQTCSHHYYLNFDNISALKEWQSDMLCRICTGEGISKRKLYTDDEDKYFSFRHCVSLNGLSNPANRADLLDRCIIIEKSLFKGERLTDVELDQKFDDIKPKIMGSIFNIISKAMNIKDTIKLDKNKIPRMADFFIWSCAISEVMGIDKDTFLKIYDENIKNKSKDILDMDIVADVILKFIDGYSYEEIFGNQKNTTHVIGVDKWDGTMSQLLDELTAICKRTYRNIPKDFPNTAEWLSRRLNSIIPNLHLENIDIIKLPRKSFSRGKRIIQIIDRNKIENNVVNNANIHQIENNVVNNANIHQIENNIENVEGTIVEIDNDGFKEEEWYKNNRYIINDLLKNDMFYKEQ